MQKISLQKIFEEINSNETKSAVFLGAGCSKNSGIPLGGEVTKLLEYLMIEKAKPSIEKSIFWNSKVCDFETIIREYENTKYLNKIKPKLIEKWRKENDIYIKDTLRINEQLLQEMPSISANKIDDLSDEEWEEIVNDSWYGFLFQKYLDGNKTLQARFFGKLLENKNPSMGYLHLALLMRFGCFNSIISTNFDKLVENTFSDYSLENKNVKTNIKLIENNETFCNKFIPKESTAMPIYKIHGGYFSVDLKNSFEDINFEDNKLYQIFDEEEIIIVIGFSGADYRIMNRLKNFLQNKEKKIIWINRDQSIEKLHKNVQSLLVFTNFHFFSLVENNLDFDSFWAKVVIEILPINLLNKKVAEYKFSHNNNFSVNQKLFDYRSDYYKFSKLSTMEIVHTYNSEQRKDNKSPEFFALLCFNMECRIKRREKITIDNFDFYYGWGNSLFRAGYFKSAIFIYEKANCNTSNLYEKIISKQNIASSNRYLGNVYQAKKILKEIEKELNSSNSRNEVWYFLKISTGYNLSELLRNYGDFDDALEINQASKNLYKTAINEGKLNKEWFDNQFNNFKDTYFDTNEAYILGQIGNESAAVELYKSVIEKMTEKNYDELAKANYAYFLTKNMEYEKAFYEFYDAFMRNPFDTNISIGLFYTMDKVIDIQKQNEIKLKLQEIFNYFINNMIKTPETIVKSGLSLFNIAKVESYHSELLEKAKKYFSNFKYEKMSFSYENKFEANFCFYTIPTTDYRGHTLLI